MYMQDFIQTKDIQISWTWSETKEHSKLQLGQNFNMFVTQYKYI